MRNRFFLAVLVILAALPGNLAWGQANLPNNPNAATVQGPDPTGQQGYPVATVPATGALAWPVAVQSFLTSLCVTQCTSPWVVSGNVGLNSGVNTIGKVDQGLSNAGGVNSWKTQLELANVMLGSLGVRGVVGLNNIADNVSQGGFELVAGVADIVRLEIPLVWNGSTGSMQRTPSVFKTVATAAAGNTALWTPAAGKAFRLQRYMVTVTDQATQAGPGTLTVSLFDGGAGATGQVHDVFVPALGLVNTGTLYTSGWIDLGNGYLSTAANNVLNINLSAALTAGTVRVICCGTEE